MRFTCVYRNEKPIRDNVIALLLSAISQGHQLNVNAISHPLFHTRLTWPTAQERLSIPIEYQCEEIEYVEGSIRTLQMNTIDIEAIVELAVEEIKTTKNE